MRGGIEHEMDYELERGDEYLPVTLVYTLSRYYPAKTYGPPENCYPAEGGEVVELSAWSDGKEIELTAKESYDAEQFIYDKHDYSEDER